jgi:hypothetical protein
MGLCSEGTVEEFGTRNRFRMSLENGAEKGNCWISCFRALDENMMLSKALTDSNVKSVYGSASISAYRIDWYIRSLFWSEL